MEHPYIVCCNIPYFLAQYLASKAVTSWARSLIAGGHFVTQLANSYGVFVPGVMRTLTCIKGTDLTMGYLEATNVVVNMGTHWSIVGDNDGEKLGQLEEQPRQRGRRNVRAQGARGQQQQQPQQFEGDVPTDPFQS